MDMCRYHALVWWTLVGLVVPILASSHDGGDTSGNRIVSCDFEMDLCGFRQSINDQLDWTRNRGRTPSDDTGPLGDHTTGNGYYLYLEATDNFPNDVAILEIDVEFATQRCLTFYYHMLGRHIGRLEVQEHDLNDFFVIWSEQGSQGDEWHRQRLDLSSGTLYVQIRGVRGGADQGQPFGDIAIDDVFVTSEACHDDDDDDRTTTTTTTTTQDPRQPGTRPRPLPDMDCQGDLEFNECGSTCEPTCDDPEPICPRQCVPQCQCPTDKPIRLNPNDVLGEPICIAKNQCGVRCRGDLVLNSCGSACERTCDNPDPPCPKICVRTCECPGDRPIRANPDDHDEMPRCIRREECPEECSGDLVFKDCASACERTCDDPNPRCTRQCVRKCECPQDRPIRLNSDQEPAICIAREVCPADCEGELVFNECGSACERTCEDPNPLCTRQCVRKCECPANEPIRLNPYDEGVEPECGRTDECAEACEGDLVFKECGSRCERTCDEPNPPCVRICERKCECPNDMVRLNPDSQPPVCVPMDRCPDPRRSVETRCPGDLEFVECGSGCERTCENPNLPCPRLCLPVCQCPSDRPILLNPGGDAFGPPVCGREDQCPAQCAGELIFKECGSACERTCDDPNPQCTRQCVATCECPANQPIRLNPGSEDELPVCVRHDECPIECEGNQVFRECGSVCERTCDNPNPPCPRICVPKCECPSDRPYLINSDDVGATPFCVSISQCPEPCAGDLVYKTCGSSCERTCDDLSPMPCTLQCVQKCECPRDRPVRLNPDDDDNPICVREEQCPMCRDDMELRNGSCTQTCNDPEPVCSDEFSTACYCPENLPVSLGGGRCGIPSDCCTEAHLVGFSAFMSRDMIRVSRGDIMVYENVFMNAGHHYSTRSGVFMCPCNGMYFFTHSWIGRQGPVSTIIMKNNVPISPLLHVNDDAASISTVAMCNQGDRVFVEIVSAPPDVMIRTRTEHQAATGFAGHLIQRA